MLMVAMLVVAAPATAHKTHEPGDAESMTVSLFVKPCRSNAPNHEGLWVRMCVVRAGISRPHRHSLFRSQDSSCRLREPCVVGPASSGLTRTRSRCQDPPHQLMRDADEPCVTRVQPGVLQPLATFCNLDQCFRLMCCVSPRADFVFVPQCGHA